MFRSILFDWSGTLCNDIELTIEATNYVLAQYGIAPLGKDAFRAEFQLPYPDYYAWKTPGAPLGELENHYRHAFGASSLRVGPIPHAKEFLSFCTSRGIRCFILSSMDSKAFEEQARELGMFDCFEGIHSGIHNKEDYIPTLMQQHKLDPASTAFIGDMQHDINAARRAGITGIGVLTGYNNAAQLAAARPDLIVPDLAALQALMRKAPLPAPDAIRLNGLELQARIGITEEERSHPQRLLADIALTPPMAFAAMGEDIAHTINYDTLAARLAAIALSRPYILLETLAHQLSECCVQEFGAVNATVELHKFILPQVRSASVRTQAQG